MEGWMGLEGEFGRMDAFRGRVWKDGWGLEGEFGRMGGFRGRVEGWMGIRGRVWKDGWV